MLRHRRGYALFPAMLLLIAGCQTDPEASDSPAAEVAEQTEPVDPRLVAALPEGASVEALESGRDLFVPCTVCHGLDATGTPLGPSLRDTVWIHGDGSIEFIAEITRSGVWSPREFEVPMPDMGGGNFDDAQLTALATYVYALSRTPA